MLEVGMVNPTECLQVDDSGKIQDKNSVHGVSPVHVHIISGTINQQSTLFQPNNDQMQMVATNDTNIQGSLSSESNIISSYANNIFDLACTMQNIPSASSTILSLQSSSTSVPHNSQIMSYTPPSASAQFPYVNNSIIP